MSVLLFQVKSARFSLQIFWETLADKLANELSTTYFKYDLHDLTLAFGSMALTLEAFCLQSTDAALLVLREVKRRYFKSAQITFKALILKP